MTDYFQILELKPGASTDEIKKAYRRLAKVHHPDRAGGNADPKTFIAINEAYEFLVDEKRRAFYEARKAKTISPEEQRRREEAYRNWVERQQRMARERAEVNASTSFDDFMESPIYRAAMVINRFYNYVFLILGVFMVITPVFIVLRDEERLIEDQISLGTILLPGVIGALFTYGVWFFLFKNKAES
ncbi:MAG: J domain-containing protein [Flavobacteriales bacterium]|nr:J domain-containing protein [Flavobacteriales bacterium]